MGVKSYHDCCRSPNREGQRPEGDETLTGPGCWSIRYACGVVGGPGSGVLGWGAVAHGAGGSDVLYSIRQSSIST
jgi:hypothetical protein